MNLYCTFTVDRYFFGVTVDQVQEVIRHQRMTRVPLASPEISGLINLRGQIVTAIDLRRRLGLPPAPADWRTMSVLIKTPDGAISLQVDQIEDVLEVAEETIERPPETLQGHVRQLITGASKLKHRLLLLLDTAKTIDLPD